MSPQDEEDDGDYVEEEDEDEDEEEGWFNYVTWSMHCGALTLAESQVTLQLTIRFLFSDEDGVRGDKRKREADDEGPDDEDDE